MKTKKLILTVLNVVLRVTRVMGRMGNVKHIRKKRLLLIRRAIYGVRVSNYLCWIFLLEQICFLVNTELSLVGNKHFFVIRKTN